MQISCEPHLHLEDTSSFILISFSFSVQQIFRDLKKIIYNDNLYGFQSQSTMVVEIGIFGHHNGRSHLLCSETLL